MNDSATPPLTDASPPAPWMDNPIAAVLACYRQRPVMPLAGPFLVEGLGFQRQAGDWLGAVVHPAGIDLVLLPGGGSLWGDIPVGERRFVSLAGVTLAFTAGHDAALGAFQYAPLVDTMLGVPDMAAARLIAADGLRMIGAPLPAPEPAATAAPDTSRRGFFRRLAGKRN